MDYVGLLTKIIKDSKLTHAEITKHCEDDGVWFNDNYISTIKNRGSIPSDDISRAIARACGRNEDLLVIQAYYDKSPKAFRDMFDSMIKIVKNIVSISLESRSDKAAIEITRKRLDEMAIAEWLEHDLPDLSNRLDAFFSIFSGNSEFGNFINAFGAANEVENACSYIAPDDSMSPIIPEGAKVHTMLFALDSLKDGDYICHQKDIDSEICIRQINFVDDSRKKMLLTPLKGKGNKEIVETSDNRLYQKVVKVVIDFE